MASDGGKLTGSDVVTYDLLSHVSHHVVTRNLKQMALGSLGLRNNDYDTIEENFPTNAKRRNLEVLIEWHNHPDRDGLMLKTFLDNLKDWQKREFISRDVWSDLGKIVSPELLPGAKTIEAPSMTGDGPTDQLNLVRAATSGAVGSISGLQRKLLVTDNELTRISEVTAPNEFSTLAIKHLGFKQSELDNIRADCKDDISKYKRTVLIKWKNRYQGPEDVGTKLDSILQAASREGLLNYDDVQQAWRESE